MQRPPVRTAVYPLPAQAVSRDGAPVRGGIPMRPRPPPPSGLNQGPGLLPLPAYPPPPAPLMRPGGLPQSQFSRPPPLLPAELGTSLSDITTTVSKLGFPASCNFVLGLLQSYFTKSLSTGDSVSKPSELTRENLHTLINLFILCQPPDSFPGGGPSGLAALLPSNEVQLWISIHRQLEDQPNMELNYCIFDAIFGSIRVSDGDVADDRFALLKRVTSFAISTRAKALLDCVSLWMWSHSPESLVLLKYIYHDFCVLLPNTDGPLLELPLVSPNFTHQLAVAFTTSHPFHSVSTKFSTVDPSQHVPPIKVLEIILHWLSAHPNIISPAPVLNSDFSELPILHSKTREVKSPFQFLVPGLMQWCILAPLHKHQDSTLQESCKNSLVDRLHAELLSYIAAVSRPRDCELPGDMVARLVANLSGYYSNQQLVAGGELKENMEESLDRFAQLLQMTISAGLVLLTQSDLTSLTSALPPNRLLHLVISHAKSSSTH